MSENETLCIDPPPWPFFLYVLHVLHVYDIELGFHGIAESACIRKTGICVGNWERKIYVAHNAGELGKYTKKEKCLSQSFHLIFNQSKNSQMKFAAVLPICNF